MLKVMSQNVMCWEKENVGTFPQRAPLMKKALLESGADVIGFQEVTPFWKEFFDKELEGFDSVIKYRSKTSLEATPIYWNKKTVELEKSGWFWLSDTPDTESLGWDAKCVRITCWCLFVQKETGKKFAFVNTHLDHRGELARQNGIKQIVAFIKDRLGDVPLILTGDFNAIPDSSTIETANSLLCDARAVAADTTDAPTFHGFGVCEPRIIDYIYLNENASCEKFETVISRDGDCHHSDHYGILATITV